jgi:hypothetical protein
MIARGVLSFATALLICSTQVLAQSAPDRRWSAEASIGWDNSISGNVHSAGIGVLNGLTTVIEERSYGDVYGTGVQFKFGAGYMLDARQQVRGTFTFQNVSADALEVGSLGTSALFATFDDYSSFALDGGYRYHFETKYPKLRPYAGATLGIAVIDEIDAMFAAPALNLALDATDFYDGTAAFTFGVEGGALYALNDRLDLEASLGFRFVSGLSEVDGLQGTGLEDINDDSGRWTLPFMVGMRVKF